MTDIHDFGRLQRTLNDVTYKDWALSILQDPHRSSAPYLQWHFRAACAKTGMVEKQGSRKWYLSPHMTESELVQTAFAAALQAEEHECREHFQYTGRRVFNPHIAIHALLSVCDVEDGRP